MISPEVFWPAGIALVLLLRISAPLTLIAVGSLGFFALALNKAFATIRPIFRERGKINAEVTGRLTESLGGVRVIKGYHAEAREEKIFAGGVQPSARQRNAYAHGDVVDESLGKCAVGVVGALPCTSADARCLAGTLTAGSYFSFNFLLVFLVAPILQIVSIGTQLTEALAGTRAHPGDHARAP